MLKFYTVVMNDPISISYYLKKIDEVLKREVLMSSSKN